MEQEKTAVTQQNNELMSQARALVDLAESTGLPLDDSGGTELSNAITQRPKSILIAALEVARHELTVMHGLMAFDGEAPSEAWSIDTSDAVTLIDKALSEASYTDTQLS